MFTQTSQKTRNDRHRRAPKRLLHTPMIFSTMTSITTIFIMIEGLDWVQDVTLRRNLQMDKMPEMRVFFRRGTPREKRKYQHSGHLQNPLGYSKRSTRSYASCRWARRTRRKSRKRGQLTPSLKVYDRNIFLKVIVDVVFLCNVIKSQC